MEVVLGENNFNKATSSGAFDGFSGMVDENQFFDLKALQKAQTDEMIDVFKEETKQESKLIEIKDNYDKRIKALQDFVKEMEANRKIWEQKLEADYQKHIIKKQIEKQIETLEEREAFIASLSESINIKNKIGALKGQISQIESLQVLVEGLSETT